MYIFQSWTFEKKCNENMSISYIKCISIFLFSLESISYFKGIAVISILRSSAKYLYVTRFIVQISPSWLLNIQGHVRAVKWFDINFVYKNVGKVHIFWEGHKILRNLPLTFDYSTYSQSKGKISQNFVAFSEYMNFNMRYLVK